jgi:hypothetical protein
MKFEDIKDLMQKPEPKADTYEAGMAQNQLLKIGTHAIKIHNMLDDDQEMESWVAKKIDLASNYVKSVHGYTAGSKAGTYDDAGMTEDADVDDLKRWYNRYSGFEGFNGDKLPFGLYMQMTQTGVPTDGMEAGEARQAIADQNPNLDPNDAESLAGSAEEIPGVDFDKADAPITNRMKSELATIMGVDAIGEDEITKAMKMLGLLKESVSEDAGEGHMSKSQLYQTAKMSIELLDMIKKGDDLEGWVQTKLNLAADYLQAVYHYEDYQKLNPYREELDGALMQKHAGVIQKSLDGILARETEITDVDTKPGMMRILKKRVNEVEKDIAKENRKNTDENVVSEDPQAVGRSLAMLNYGKEMATAIINGGDPIDVKSKAQAYMGGVDRAIKELDMMYKTHTTESELEEGIKDWAKNLAMAGIIVAGMAGVNSINNAIDNSVPAIQAMNSALEMAQDQNDDDLAQLIKKDLSDAKLRLDTGKDLSHVKDLQDKYAKFMKTEDMAYETVLQLKLESKIKS